MLTELSVVEQRYLAVREALDGVKVTDVATRYGVDRRTVHRWLARYATEGLGALGRPELEAGPVSAPDRPRDRGQDRGAAPISSGLGPADHPFQAAPGSWPSLPPGPRSTAASSATD